MDKSLHVSMNILRLWKIGMCNLSNFEVNEHPLVEGEIGLMKGNLEHHDSMDLHHWLESKIGI